MSATDYVRAIEHPERYRDPNLPPVDAPIPPGKKADVVNLGGGSSGVTGERTGGPGITSGPGTTYGSPSGETVTITETPATQVPGITVTDSYTTTNVPSPYTNVRFGTGSPTSPNEIVVYTQAGKTTGLTSAGIQVPSGIDIGKSYTMEQGVGGYYSGTGEFLLTKALQQPYEVQTYTGTTRKIPISESYRTGEIIPVPTETIPTYVESRVAQRGTIGGAPQLMIQPTQRTFAEDIQFTGGLARGITTAFTTAAEKAGTGAGYIFGTAFPTQQIEIPGKEVVSRIPSGTGTYNPRNGLYEQPTITTYQKPTTTFYSPGKEFGKAVGTGLNIAGYIVPGISQVLIGSSAISGTSRLVAPKSTQQILQEANIQKYDLNNLPYGTTLEEAKRFNSEIDSYVSQVKKTERLQGVLEVAPAALYGGVKAYQFLKSPYLKLLPKGYVPEKQVGQFIISPERVEPIRIISRETVRPVIKGGEQLEYGGFALKVSKAPRYAEYSPNQLYRLFFKPKIIEVAPKVTYEIATVKGLPIIMREGQIINEGFVFGRKVGGQKVVSIFRVQGGGKILDMADINFAKLPKVEQRLLSSLGTKAQGVTFIPTSGGTVYAEGGVLGIKVGRASEAGKFILSKPGTRLSQLATASKISPIYETPEYTIYNVATAGKDVTLPTYRAMAGKLIKIEGLSKVYKTPISFDNDFTTGISKLVLKQKPITKSIATLQAVQAKLIPKLPDKLPTFAKAENAIAKITRITPVAIPGLLQRQIQTPILKERLIQKPKLETMTIQKSFNLPKLSPLVVTTVTEVPRLGEIQIQIPTVITKPEIPIPRPPIQRPIQKPIRPPSPPELAKIGTPNIKPPAIGDVFRTERKRKAIKKPTGFFIPEVRRRGTFRPIATTTTAESAIAIGKAKVRQTLGASFRIRTPRGGFLPLAPSEEFRTGKTPFALIQRRTARLSSFGEKSEFKAARRTKSSMRKIWGLK